MWDNKLPNTGALSAKPDPKAGRKFFGGKLDGFESNHERHFYQRMLKAYLDGKIQFPFGFEKELNPFTGKRDPIFHNVQFTDNTGVLTKEYRDALFADGYTHPGKVFGGVKPGKGQLKKILIRRDIDKKKEELKALSKGIKISKEKKAKIKYLTGVIKAYEEYLSNRKSKY